MGGTGQGIRAEGQVSHAQSKVTRQWKTAGRAWKGKEGQNWPGPDWCVLVGWVSCCKPKRHGFDSRSEPRPGLRVWPPVWACMRGNQSMFLSHIDVSLPFFLLSTLSLSKKRKKERTVWGHTKEKLGEGLQKQCFSPLAVPWLTWGSCSDAGSDPAAPSRAWGSAFLTGAQVRLPLAWVLEVCTTTPSLPGLPFLQTPPGWTWPTGPIFSEWAMKEGHLVSSLLQGLLPTLPCLIFTATLDADIKMTHIFLTGGEKRFPREARGCCFHGVPLRLPSAPDEAEDEERSVSNAPAQSLGEGRGP